jgi:hypothetical protein
VEPSVAWRWSLLRDLRLTNVHYRVHDRTQLDLRDNAMRADWLHAVLAPRMSPGSMVLTPSLDLVPGFDKIPKSVVLLYSYRMFRGTRADD